MMFDSIAGHQANVAVAISGAPSDDILTVTTGASVAGVVTLVVVGEVDMFTASLLRSSITGQLEGRPRELVTSPLWSSWVQLVWPRWWRPRSRPATATSAFG